VNISQRASIGAHREGFTTLFTITPIVRNGQGVIAGHEKHQQSNYPLGLSFPDGEGVPLAGCAPSRGLLEHLRDGGIQEDLDSGLTETKTEATTMANTNFNATKDVPFQPASVDIWDSKYHLKDKHGNPVDGSMVGTYDRVAEAVAEVEPEENRETWKHEFRWALENGAIPAGRIMSNAGAEEHKPAVSLINCTVSRTIRDSMRDILEANMDAGMTLKAGCGIGYEWSTLRPKGAFVAGAGASTNGPLAFMDIFDKMCFTVSSAGGRRGAQMGTFDIGHPDVEEFIVAKREDGRLRQFNLSLLITDEFIEAVRNEAVWPLAFPLLPSEKDDVSPEELVYRDWPVIEEGYTLDEEGRVACRVYQRVKAKALWDKIMQSTYDFAEPGFILIDKVNEMNNNWFCEQIRATNP
jgi:ribonucleoside-diphosphate reductase alpha chain